MSLRKTIFPLIAFGLLLMLGSGKIACAVQTTHTQSVTLGHACGQAEVLVNLAIQLALIQTSIG